jgi:hypothetical protein
VLLTEAYEYVLQIRFPRALLFAIPTAAKKFTLLSSVTAVHAHTAFFIDAVRLTRAIPVSLTAGRAHPVGIVLPAQATLVTITATVALCAQTPGHI